MTLFFVSFARFALLDLSLTNILLQLCRLWRRVTTSVAGELSSTLSLGWMQKLAKLRYNKNQ